MELNSRLAALEHEVNLLKVEIKQVLVDLRDVLLSHENPFSNPRWDEASGESGPPKIKKGDAAPPATAVSEEAVGQPVSSAPADSRSPSPLPDVADGASAVFSSPQWSDREGVRHPPTVQRRAAGWSVLTVASLAKWVDSAIKQVGRDRFEAIIAIYDLATGGAALPHEAKETLLKLAALSDARDERPPATMKDCIALLAQLDAILGSDGRSDATILSLLTNLDVR